MNRAIVAGAALGAAGLIAAPFIAVDAAPVRCAWVNSTDDSIVTFQTFEGLCPPDRLHKNIKWLPAPVATPPAFDPATQVRTKNAPVVGPTEVTESYTVRAKTAQELDAERDALTQGMNIAVFESLCHLKNQIRTKVDGLTAWSRAECFDAFKALIP